MPRRFCTPAWAEAGLFPREELLKLRTIGSDLEGHPTPRLPFVDVATGSLGQGICASIGIGAERAPHRVRLPHVRAPRRRRDGGRIGVGGGRPSRVPQARQPVRRHRRQRARAESGDAVRHHDMDEIAARWASFGWHTIVVDGHDIAALSTAYAEARATKGRPTMILARTLKGKGDRRNRGQGRLARQGAEEGRRGRQGGRGAAEADGRRRRRRSPRFRCRSRRASRTSSPITRRFPPPAYTKGDLVATREAWGSALAASAAPTRAWSRSMPT